MAPAKVPSRYPFPNWALWPSCPSPIDSPGATGMVGTCEGGHSPFSSLLLNPVGCAFVKFQTHAEAQAAINTLHSSRTLPVSTPTYIHISDGIFPL